MLKLYTAKSMKQARLNIGTVAEFVYAQISFITRLITSAIFFIVEHDVFSSQITLSG